MIGQPFLAETASTKKLEAAILAGLSDEAAAQLIAATAQLEGVPANHAVETRLWQLRDDLLRRPLLPSNRRSNYRHSACGRTWRQPVERPRAVVGGDIVGIKVGEVVSVEQHHVSATAVV